MMGHQPDAQPKLFYHSFNLDDRIPAASVLRKIRKHIDFEVLSIRRSKTLWWKRQCLGTSARDTQDDVAFDFIQCSIRAGTDEYPADAIGLAVVFRL